MSADRQDNDTAQDVNDASHSSQVPRIDLKILSPGSGIPESLYIRAVPVDTSIIAIKQRIAAIAPTHPPPEAQRLIYQGHVVARDTTTLGELFGPANIAEHNSFAIHLVLRPRGGSTSRPSSRTAVRSEIPSSSATASPPSTSRIPVPVADTHAALSNPSHAAEAPPAPRHQPQPFPFGVRPQNMMPAFMLPPQMPGPTPGIPIGAQGSHAQFHQMQLQQHLQQMQQQQLHQLHPNMPGHVIDHQQPQPPVSHSTPAPQAMPGGVATFQNPMFPHATPTGEQQQQPSQQQHQATPLSEMPRAQDTRNHRAYDTIGPDGARYRIAFSHTVVNNPVQTARGSPALSQPQPQPQLHQQQQQQHSGLSLPPGAEVPLNVLHQANMQHVLPSMLSPTPPFGLSPFGPFPFPMGIGVGTPIGLTPPQLAAAATGVAGSMVYLLSSPSGPHALVYHPDGVFGSNFFTAPSQSAAPSRVISRTSSRLRQGAESANVGVYAVQGDRQQDDVVVIGAAQELPAQPQPQPQAQPQQGEPDMLAQFQPLLGQVWLLLRIMLFAYFFLGHGPSWHRPVGLACLGLGFVLLRNANVGVQARAAVARWWEGVIGIRRAEAEQARQGQAQAQAQEATGAAQVPAHAPQPEAHQVGVRRILRPVERALALFIASLWPGVGEQTVRARRELEERLQRQQRERDEAAERVRLEAEVGASGGTQSGDSQTESEEHAKDDVVVASLGDAGASAATTATDVGLGSSEAVRERRAHS